MRILLVSSYLPFPLFSGGHIRLYNIIKRLSEKNHEVTLVCEMRPNQTAQDVAEVAKICKFVFTVPRKKQWSMKNILQSGFSKNAFLITGHTNERMQEKIATLLQEHNYHLIHAETSYIVQNIPATNIPIILIEHNIEYLVYERFVKNVPFILRPLLRIDVNKLRRYEEVLWKQATYIVTVSEKEKQIIGLPNISVVPNGVDTKIFQVKKDLLITNKSQISILFIGDFKWVQNRDSARWIIDDIYPKIGEYFQHARKISLWIVGKNIPNGIKNVSDDQTIIFDEDTQKSTERIFSDADVLLAPIRIGGGTQYKILEAMASGTPVITTPLGIEGIDAIDEKEVLVGQTSQDLARLTAKVIEDEGLYKSVAINARTFIEKNYTWEIVVEKLEAVYKKVVPL